MNNYKGKRHETRKKNLAQSRLDRIREEQKLTRKMEEKVEKFRNQQTPANCDSLTATDIFADKFLSDANRVEFRGNTKAGERKQPTEKGFNRPRISPKKISQESKSVEVSRSVKLSKVERTQKSASINKYNNHPNKSEPVIEGGVCQGEKRPRKRRSTGIAAERLKKIGKSPLGVSPGKEREENPVLRERKSSSGNDGNTRRTSCVINESYTKIPNDRSRANSNGVISRKTNLIDPVFAEPKLQSNVNLFSNCDTVNFDDMCMDVDIEDLSENADVASDSQKLPDKWLEKKSENVAFFVNEIEQLRKDSRYLALHENHAPDIEMNLSVPCGDLLIVIDTNIFLSHLKFLSQLLKSNIDSYRSHVLVVPWLIIEEIDCIMKNRSRRLASQARLANSFIFECLKKENSKLFGQSFEDFKINFKNAVSVDDFLLQYCLKLIELRNNVILLSDDRNLVNKCMFSHVAAYSKDDFENVFNIYKCL